MSDALVQSKTVGAGPGGFTSTTTAGDLLLCVVIASYTGSSSSGGVTISTPVTTGITWTLLDSDSWQVTVPGPAPTYLPDTYDGAKLAVYYAVGTNAPSIASSVQTSVSASKGTVTFGLYEFSGILKTNPVDDYVAAYVESGTPSAGNLSLTGTDLVFCACSTEGTVNVGSGYTAGLTTSDQYDQYILNDTSASQSTAFGTGDVAFSLVVAGAFKNFVNATASPFGVSATSADHAPTGSGAGKASTTGNAMSSAVGTAFGSLAAIANAAGVRMTSAQGTPLPSFTWECDFGSVVAGSEPLPGGVNSTYSYARFVGYLVPSITGVYTVGVNASGGVNLYIAGNGIITNLSPGNDTANSTLAYTRSNNITLTAGIFYALVLEWQNGLETPELQLLWTPPNEGVQLVNMVNVSDRASGVVAVPTKHINSTWWNGTSGLWYPPKW